MNKITLLILITLASLADGALTTYLVLENGTHIELNPMLKLVMDMFGVWALMAVKITTCALLWSVIAYIRIRALYVVAAIYGLLMIYWGFILC